MVRALVPGRAEMSFAEATEWTFVKTRGLPRTRRDFREVAVAAKGLVLVDAFGGKLNVLYKAEGLSVKEIAGLGVARISMGPWLQIVGERAIKEEAQRILDEVKSLD